jgi:hypothetical protein
MKTDTSKSTMLVVSTGFLALFLLFSWRWALYVALIVGLIGILSSFLSRKFEWVWMKFANLLGFIIPNLLLSIVFYLFLFPISLLSKLFNKDPLMLSDNFKTYFLDITQQADKKSFEKIW